MTSLQSDKSSQGPLANDPSSAPPALVSLQQFERHPERVRATIAKAYRELKPGERRDIGNIDTLVSMHDAQLLPNFPLPNGKCSDRKINIPLVSSAVSVDLVIRRSVSGDFTLALTLQRVGSDQQIGRAFRIVDNDLMSAHRYMRPRSTISLKKVNQIGERLEREGLHPDEVSARLIAERLGIPWSEVTRYSQSPWVRITAGRLEKAVQFLHSSHGREPIASEVARHLGVTTRAVVNSILNRRHAGENVLWAHIGIRRQASGHVSRKREWIDALVSASQSDESRMLLLAAGFKLLSDRNFKPLHMHLLAQAVLHRSADIEKVDEPVARRFSVSRNSRLRAWFGERSEISEVPGFTRQIDQQLAKVLKPRAGKPEDRAAMERFRQVVSAGLRAYVREHLYTVATEEMRPSQAIHQKIAEKLASIPDPRDYNPDGLSLTQRNAFRYLIHQRMLQPSRKVSYAELAPILNIREGSISRALHGEEPRPGAIAKIKAHAGEQADSVDAMYRRLRRNGYIAPTELHSFLTLVDSTPMALPEFSCSEDRKKLLITRLSRRAQGLGIEAEDVAAALNVSKRHIWSQLAAQNKKHSLTQIADGHLASQGSEADGLTDLLIAEIEKEPFSFAHWVPKIFPYITDPQEQATVVRPMVNAGGSIPDSKYIDINPNHGEGPNRFLYPREVAIFFETYFRGGYENIGEFQTNLAHALNMPGLTTNNRDVFWRLFRGKKAFEINRPGLIERISDELDDSPPLRSALREGSPARISAATKFYERLCPPAVEAAKQLIACSPLSDDSFAIVEAFSIQHSKKKSGRSEQSS